MLDDVGAGVDDARDEDLLRRERDLGKHRPLVLMAGIRPLDRETVCMHLIDDVQNLGEGKVVVVRARVVTPADMDADSVGIDSFQRLVEDLHMELDPGAEVRDRRVRKIQVAAEGEIRTVDLQDESPADDCPVLLAQSITKRGEEGPATGVVRRAHEHGDGAGRHRGQERLLHGLVLDFGRQGIQLRGKPVPADVSNRTVVGWHRRAWQRLALGDEEPLRDLGEVEQVTWREWARRSRSLEAAQTVSDVVGKPRLAHLAIADDVDPGRDLALHGLAHGSPHLLAQVFTLGQGSFFNEEDRGEIRWPGQTPGIRGKDPLGASLHLSAWNCRGGMR